MLPSFTILFWCALLSSSSGVQCKAAYKLKLNRVDVTRYNKTYVDWRVWITKPNRNTNAVNGNFTIYNIPRDTKVTLKMYEFLSNEYRPFAINLRRNLCDFMMLEYRMFIRIRIDMPEPRCPIKPGNYSFVNQTPSIDTYPPNLPFRNWMLTLEFWHGTVEVALLTSYGILDRDAVIREQYG